MIDHISVCICTYHRNQMLERLVKKVAIQETGGLFDFSVVVVDNDTAGPAQQTVMRLKEELGLEIAYGIEPEHTIPAARNHALRLARGNYIGIIDDDEFAPPYWLITMYRAIATFDVDGALGPVHPFFEQQPPEWLIRGGFCDRPVHRTGTLLHWDQTRTGNVLLKKDVFDKNNIVFDLQCRTSGSDRVFFEDAMRAGCRFVAVEEAPVYETVLPERWTKRYYLNRALLQGANAHKNFVGRIQGLSKVTVMMRAIAGILWCLTMLPFSSFIGSHAVMKYLEKGAYHLSRLLAMMGVEVVTKRNF